VCDAHGAVVQVPGVGVEHEVSGTALHTRIMPGREGQCGSSGVQSSSPIRRSGTPSARHSGAMTSVVRRAHRGQSHMASQLGFALRGARNSRSADQAGQRARHR
jgi:hypothetical protein